MYTLWSYSDYCGVCEPSCKLTQSKKEKLLAYLKKEGLIRHYYGNFFILAEKAISRYEYDGDEDEWREVIEYRNNVFELWDWKKFVTIHPEKLFKVVNEEDEDPFITTIEEEKFYLEELGDAIGFYKNTEENYHRMGELKISGLFENIDLFKDYWKGSKNEKR